MNRILILLLLLSACGYAEVEDVCPSQIKQPAFVRTDRLWDTEKVSVCWVNPSAENNRQRQIVREAVQSGWDDEIDLDFVWTERCTSEPSNIRILIIDERPRSHVGKIISTNWTMKLNFGFQNWGLLSCAGDDLADERCIIREARHEFGHALSFQHEHERSDTPETCALLDETEETPEGEQVGPYDPNGIMNYCAHTLRPSCEEIQVVQSLYRVEND